MTDDRIDALIRGLDDRAGDIPFGPLPVPASVRARVRAARRDDATLRGRLGRDLRTVRGGDVLRDSLRSRPWVAVAAATLLGVAVIGAFAAGSRPSVPGPDRATASLPAIAIPSVSPSAVVPPTSAAPTPDSSPSPVVTADRGWLVFSTNGRLVVQRGDGSARRNLTDGSVADYFPAWSPDGRQVAFFSQRCTFGERCPDKVVDSALVVINVDGTGRRTLRSGLQNPGGLRWLPDGSALIESAFRATGGPITERVDLDGAVHPATVQTPAYLLSPDGSEVLIANPPDRSASSILIANADGSASRLLVSVPKPGEWLSIVGWSPDGQSIAYNVRTTKYGRDAETWLVGRDGAGAHAWTLPAGGRLVGWSPDGRWILVMAKSANSDAAGVYVVARADGSDPRTLSITALSYGWAPGGSWLLGLRSGPIDSLGTAAAIVVVDPAGDLDAVDIETPGLLGYDWHPDD
jgi:TolB protein